MEKTMDKIVALAKSRGFVYPGSEIYGGLANTWDYGNLGVELKNNVKRAWWKKFVQESKYNVGVDCAILNLPSETIGEEMYELLTMANQTTEDVFSLLDNLLKWTKSQIGKLKVVYQELNMVEVVEGVSEIFTMVAGLKNIKIVQDMPVVPVVVRADIDMLKTVIRNLISNAIKFSNEGSEVLVSLTEEDGMAIVSVKDSGCGIEEENQKKLLHTDTHFSTFGTNNEEGSGLGLLLCQDFIVKNGGKLWFTSKKGEGSTFSFSVPLLEK